MVPMYKRCNVCGRRYSWNPDVGQMYCPSCGSFRQKKALEKWIKILWKSGSEYFDEIICSHIDKKISIFKYSSRKTG